MILITGAAGKTGNAVLNALALRGVRTKALVRSAEQGEKIIKIHKTEIVIGDLRDVQALRLALEGVSKIYFIAPNMAPDELEIGSQLIKVAREKGINRFVYHSVLHPQVSAMPHHWNKLLMEEALFTSGLNFTILQPCAYMQNVLGTWDRIKNEGKYVVPYSVESRISIVDLDDIGKVAANVLMQTGHANAIYELAGPEPLSQVEVAAKMSAVLGREVSAVEQPHAEWEKNAHSGGLGEQEIEWLLKMFTYYDQYGLIGNSRTLQSLLDEVPTSFTQFLERTLKKESGRK